MPGSTKTYSYRFSRNSAVQTQSDRLLRCFLVATAFSPVHACLFLVFREHRTATAIYLFWLPAWIIMMHDVLFHDSGHLFSLSRIWMKERTKLSEANDAACTRSLCSIRPGSTNGINSPCPLDQTPSVSPAELLLSRKTRRTLAQLRTNKSPLLVSYLFSIGDPRHPSPLCPLCLMHDHTSSHLFECKSLPTSLSSLDLWTNPDKVEPFLATWGERLLAATWFGCWTLLAARLWSGVDNNNNNNNQAFKWYVVCVNISN